MAPNISVGRGVFASAFFALCLGLVVTQTFAQTVTQQTVQDDKAGLSLVYVPPTGGERLKWAVDGTFGATSIATDVFLASWNTAWNTPSEWGASWSGFGKRSGSRESQMTISKCGRGRVGRGMGRRPTVFSLWPHRDLGANLVRGENGVRCPSPERSIDSCVGALCGGDLQQSRLRTPGSPRARRRRRRTCAGSATDSSAGSSGTCGMSSGPMFADD